MNIVEIEDLGKGFAYQWPELLETYDYFIDYAAIAEDGKHTVRIAFGKRYAYGSDRVRVVVFIDGYPHAEFLGADDVEKSGDIVSEIRIPGDVGERICRYPDEAVPERYAMFDVEGLTLRVRGRGVHNSWAVVANIADHRGIIALAALRRLERAR